MATTTATSAKAKRLYPQTERAIGNWQLAAFCFWSNQSLRFAVTRIHAPKKAVSRKCSQRAHKKVQQQRSGSNSTVAATAAAVHRAALFAADRIHFVGYSLSCCDYDAN